METELPLWRMPSPLHLDDVTLPMPVLPMFHFAAPGPPQGPQNEPPNPVEERKRFVSEALVQQILETNQTYYPQYTATGVAADEAERLKNEEEDTIARFLNTHMDDALPADQPPSPHAREIARSSYFVNRSARTDAAATKNPRQKKQIKDAQHNDLMRLVSGYLNVGQARHVIDQAPLPPVRTPWQRRARERIDEIPPANRRRIAYGLGGLAAAGLLIWGVAQIVNAVSHSHTSQTYPAGQCFEASTGTVVSGSTISIGADNQNQKPLNADTSIGVVLLVNKPITVCAGSLPMTATFADGDTDAIGQQIKTDRADLLNNGCADNKGCRRVLFDTYS